MKKADLPSNEEERLLKLQSYEILDTLPEHTYDDIVELASYICQTPIAMISFVDKERQWFKAKKGVTAKQTHRDVAFCAHAILDPSSIMVIEDAIEDPRFANNPLVISDPKIRFYAGAPLCTTEGGIGVLCVVDRKPRKITQRQKNALTCLARSTIAMLNLRLTVLTLEREKHHVPGEDVISSLIEELKNL